MIDIFTSLARTDLLQVNRTYHKIRPERAAEALRWVMHVTHSEQIPTTDIFENYNEHSYNFLNID